VASPDAGATRLGFAMLHSAGADAVPAYRTLLERADDQTPVRLICSFLALMGTDGADAADAVEALLAKRPSEREHLLSTLARIAPDRARPHSAALASCARSESPNAAFCRSALTPLGGPESVPFLLEALHDPAVGTRARAARDAQQAPYEELREALSAALRDSDLEVRISAAGTILTHDLDAPATVLALLLTGVCGGRGFNAVIVSNALAQHDKVAERAKEELMRILRGPEEPCHARAAMVLGSVHPHRAVPALALLRQALRDDDTDIRRGAAYALEQMGAEATAALPDLEPMLDHENARLRAAAKSARERIQHPAIRSRRIEEFRLVALHTGDDGARVADLMVATGHIHPVKEGQLFLDGRLEKIGADGAEFRAERVTDTFAVSPWSPRLRLFEREGPAAFKSTPDYTGSHVSVDFDGDVASFVSLIARLSGLNVALEGGTRARIVSSVRDAPWDGVVKQALESAGLGYRLDQDFLRIGRRDRLARMRPLSTEPAAGHRVSLHVLNTAPAHLELLFGQISGLDVRFPAGADAPISLHVTDVPWDQAFDLVVASQGWTYRIDGATVHVERAPEPSTTE
jgi:hypothetical protein